VDCLQRGKQSGAGDTVNIVSKILQGDLYSAHHDYDAAEAILWSALSAQLLFIGPKDPRFVFIWIKYQSVKKLQNNTREASNQLPQRPQGVCNLSEQPVRCLLRPRSSSQPPIDRRDSKAVFSDEAPI
jgi:hypothetical protein